MISWRHFVEIITAEHEGALPESERASFHEHRTVCPPCRHYADSFERTVDLLHELPREPAPEAMRARLLAQLRASKGQGT